MFDYSLSFGKGRGEVCLNLDFVGLKGFIGSKAILPPSPLERVGGEANSKELNESKQHIRNNRKHPSCPYKQFIW